MNSCQKHQIRCYILQSSTTFDEMSKMSRCTGSLAHFSSSTSGRVAVQRLLKVKLPEGLWEHSNLCNERSLVIEHTEKTCSTNHQTVQLQEVVLPSHLSRLLQTVGVFRRDEAEAETLYQLMFSADPAMKGLYYKYHSHPSSLVFMFLET